MRNKIWLSLAQMGGMEQFYIKEAFDTNWVVPLGPNVDAFEKDLEHYINEDKKVVALNSGTAAIHLALIQMGVGIGDEVICQSFTFTATANPIVYLGATPIFVDSEADTWNIDPNLLEQVIVDRIKHTGKKPKAIITVHLYGMPAKMLEILEIASRYQIPVFEDAAEALGSEYNGKKCGIFGDFACFSFNGNKIITTSGGGALICNTKQQAEKTLFYATQAREIAPYYQHIEIGYNYRLSNICAGIGRGQMMILQDHIDGRRANNQYYRSKLSGIKGLSFHTEPDEMYRSNYWLTAILIDPSQTGGKTNEDLFNVLKAEDIESRLLWKPMHLQPVFANCPYYGNGVSKKIFSNGLCIPSSSILTNEDLDRVISTIQCFFSS
ncbi:MAG: aminotransferase class I/II-fold pyridoxal phosphate-dependent enzyme [Paludibacter sp.]